MEIWDSDGNFFASPDFTPMILNQIISSEMNNRNQQYRIKTNIESGKKLLVFYKSYSGRAITYYTNHDDGYYSIVVDISDNNGSYKFYVFADKVPFVYDYGIYFYLNNEIIYTDSCIPLSVKYVTPNSISSLDQSKSYAVTPSYTRYDQLSNDYANCYGMWAGEIGAGVAYAKRAYANDLLDASYAGSLCINTEIYDRNYKYSLGL